MPTVSGFSLQKGMSAIKEFVESLSLLIILIAVLLTQSTLTNAMNLIYFNAVRELAHVSPFRVVRKRNKYAVTADITQWKGYQFLMA